MRYKELNKENVYEVIDVFINAFNKEPWNDKWEKEIVLKRLNQMINCEGYFGLISYYNNKVSGMILGNHEYYYDGMHFQIKEFCVDESIQGKGIGSALLNEFIHRLKDKNIYNIYLITCKVPKTEGFYEKHGFKVENSIILMEKKI